MTRTETLVWAAWSDACRADDPTPVKSIARKLGLDNATVAAIVYPAEIFGKWSDEQEWPLA